jgi:hypothetical protein
MGAAAIEARLRLPADLGPLLHLSVLIPLGAAIYVGAIFLLDRRLLQEFVEFVRAAFARQWNRRSAP